MPIAHTHTRARNMHLRCNSRSKKRVKFVQHRAEAIKDRGQLNILNIHITLNTTSRQRRGGESHHAGRYTLIYIYIYIYIYIHT